MASYVVHRRTHPVRLMRATKALLLTGPSLTFIPFSSEMMAPGLPAARGPSYSLAQEGGGLKLFVATPASIIYDVIK